MSKQTQNSSFKREDKSQLGAEGDAVIIGPTFMQNIHVIPLVFGCTAISLILKLHIWAPMAPNMQPSAFSNLKKEDKSPGS